MKQKRYRFNAREKTAKKKNLNYASACRGSRFGAGDQKRTAIKSTHFGTKHLEFLNIYILLHYTLLHYSLLPITSKAPKASLVKSEK